MGEGVHDARLEITWFVLFADCKIYAGRVALVTRVGVVVSPRDDVNEPELRDGGGLGVLHGGRFVHAAAEKERDGDCWFHVWGAVPSGCG